jgi:stage III sporulation protein AE
MIKKVFCFSIVVIFILSFSICAFSYDYNDDIFDNLDDTTKEYLNELGLNEVSFDKLFELTPTRVIEFIFSLAFDKTISLIKNFINIFFVMLILAIASSYLNENKQLTKMLNYISVLIILAFIMEPISRTLTDTAVGLKTSGVFINAYLPVMIGIIVASRNPSLAITYNTFSVILSNVISFLSNKILVPCISVMFSLNIISSLSDDNYHLKLNKSIRRLVVLILSLFSTLYTGMLSLQSILASSADSFALKGIKFISGTFIPIVGSNVSDAISSVISSFLIMKSTLGVFIIITIILINLPVMVELLIWYFFLELCSIFSSLLKIDTITFVYESFASTISLLNIVLFFITFVLIISTGIIIIMGK